MNRKDIIAKVATFDNKLLVEALLQEAKKAGAFDIEAFERVDILRAEVLRRMEAEQ